MSMYPENVRSRPIEYSSEREFPMFKFFNQVYAWMCVGVALTGLVGWLTAQSGIISKNPIIPLLAAIGSLVLAFTTRSVAMRIGAGVGMAMFLAYSILVGVMISYIFIRYPVATLISAFFVTGGLFGGMSVIGFVTKKDLTGIGGIAMMALLGLILASIVNIFVASTAMDWIITYAIVLVFSALTAYDTQKLKEIAIEHAHNPSLLQRAAVVGSLELYLDFINLFLAILKILGSRK